MTELAGQRVIWTPYPGAQTAFVSCGVYEALYGGQAGPGKTDCLVVLPLRWVGEPGFNGIIFRRTFPELEGQVIPRSREIYPVAGGQYNSVQHCWTFPSGARIHFGHLQHEADVYRYQGWEFQYIGFDELTQFTEKQYTYLLSRARSTRGIPIRIRSSSNPGGEGHEWVFKRWAPWLDPKAAVKAALRQVLHYVPTPRGDEWVSPGTANALTRVFIPGRMEDNPALMQNDPGYRDRLGGLDAVTRAQLRDGDWLARPAAGAYFKRSYFDIVDAAPAEVADRVRRWDLAATEPEKGRDPDWTVGLKMSKTRDGIYYVEDVARFRESPHKVEFGIRTTAELDGKRCRVMLPQDPGQAGKAQVAYYIRSLVGFDVRATPETGDKVTRAQPVSAQCEARNVKLVRGTWNEEFIRELEAFPEGGHDDQVDALSGAFLALLNARVPTGTSADPFMDY